MPEDLNRDQPPADSAPHYDWTFASISINYAGAIAMAVRIQMDRTHVDEWRARCEKEGFGKIIDIAVTADGVNYELTFDQFAAALQPFKAEA